jgi:NAD(P)-dependent dehydrogenase (short-subunit alcohol dehydrogenase family)
MTGRLTGKVAIVTGAGRGIGRGEALALASEGARIVVNDLGGGIDGSGASRSPADEVAAQIRSSGGEAISNYDTVNTWQGGESMVNSALASFGRLDIIVNNAGIIRDRMVYNMSESEWDRSSECISTGISTLSAMPATSSAGSGSDGSSIPPLLPGLEEAQVRPTTQRRRKQSSD